ncbi:MAG TPA: glycosyltransferase family 2 protein [Terriglobia bacterium]|nr:glycosyltransferase family 2 protein [Terriglobia bacterium]
MVWLFWISLAFISYTFVGYPTLLWMLSWRGSKSHQRANIWPKVSLIIVAHNAAKVIREKLENTLELDYPSDKLEVIVVSDGSTDHTAEIVRQFAPKGVTLIEVGERRGKGHAEMIARDSSQGEILAFTDASVMLEPVSLRRMIDNFADVSVGVVSSTDVIETRAGGAGEGSYVNSEMGLRRLESCVGSLVSVSGSFWGARRQVCERWKSEGCGDFFVPLRAVAQGYRVVMDPQCRARFAVLQSGRAEFLRKVRTIVQGLDVLFSHLTLLNPFRYGLFSWQLASHKLFRWLLPFAFIALLVSNILLWNSTVFYRAFLLLQLCGYGLGVVVWALEDRLDLRLLRLPAFFLMGNAATLVAWVNFSLGKRYVVWQPSQRA